MGTSASLIDKGDSYRPRNIYEEYVSFHVDGIIITLECSGNVYQGKIRNIDPFRKTERIKVEVTPERSDVFWLFGEEFPSFMYVGQEVIIEYDILKIQVDQHSKKSYWITEISTVRDKKND